MALIHYWYCQACGEVIPKEELKIVREVERHYWLDDCPAEVSYRVYCPYCGAEEIDEAEYCEYCGEPCNPKDLIDGLCEICRNERNEKPPCGANT